MLGALPPISPLHVGHTLPCLHNFVYSSFALKSLSLTFLNEAGSRRMNTSILGNVTSSMVPSSIPFHVVLTLSITVTYQRYHIIIIITFCEFLQLGNELLEGEVYVLHILESFVPITMPRT